MSKSCLLVTVTRPYALDIDVSRVADVVSLSVSDLTERMAANVSASPSMKTIVSLATSRPKVHISKVCHVAYSPYEVFCVIEGAFLLADGKRFLVLKEGKEDERLSE